MLISKVLLFSTIVLAIYITSTKYGDTVSCSMFTQPTQGINRATRQQKIFFTLHTFAAIVMTQVKTHKYSALT